MPASPSSHHRPLGMPKSPRSPAADPDRLAAATTAAGPRPDLADTARPATLTDLVLRQIWTQRTISRADIARHTALSRSTVSDIVAYLLTTGLVAEAGVGASSGGRPAIMLAFQDDARVILGVDIGATHVAVALTDLRGHVLAWHHRPHPVQADPDGTRALVTDLCSSCLAQWGGHPQRLVGIGVALPSPIDPQHPGRVSDLALPQWRGHHGMQKLQQTFGVPVMVDNDANLGALAEHWWGAGRGIDDFAYIKMATGIGSGHIIGGRLFRGASGVAGEIGHLAIDPRGEPCVCGNRGCLGTLVGAQALIARAKALRADYPDSLLATGALASGDITIAAIEDAALADDPLALEVVSEAARHLGIAVAGMLNLMNPSVVILGGGLSRLDDLLLRPLRETVLRRTFVSSLVASEIRATELGPRAIAVGAATLVLDSALRDPSRFLTHLTH